MNNIFEKTKIGKNSIRSAIITAVVEFVIQIAVFVLESLVGDAVVRWLNSYGLSLASFINWIVSYPLLSSVVFFLVFLALLMYADWKKNRDAGNSLLGSVAQTHSGSGDNVAGDKHVYLGGFREDFNNTSQEKLKKSLSFDITPTVIKNEEWVSVIIPNPTSRTIRCYCVLKYVKLNGNVDEEIMRYVTAHTSRISWSGGDTAGEGEGVKLIEGEKMINIVSPTSKGLGFEMAKGTRYLEENKNYGVGVYKVCIEINYCRVEETEFQSKLFDVDFDCYMEKSKIVDENMPSNILRRRISPLFHLGNSFADYLYVKILK